ncbi:polysaccharide pyruvyl transferase family protein [Alloyangia pacifica]|uniref:Polysaccharide pyruvyl transferase family protein WcaK n=1 Tax=Alloyangia pacifica TaxID=311180 RepID=A0A1I6T3Q0_9RHOB|nr:polysaccharide pyruvyl transferase family protein [Alloyangia pacifica]SDG96420.1 Polysaccharide pyruvyl transferase family protein WcaK [Alloyangia pacifica]SFS83806.1 Polysaccharide pyruvyl transferase family protein WcaK [Alloyangia pacifica]
MLMTDQGDAGGHVIRCLNVKYSPNLGDGLLSECLEKGLKLHGASSESSSIDLAGRTEFGQTITGRGAVMTVLDALPDGLRGLAVRAPLALQSRRKWGPHYEAGLIGADAVAIGGGNLLSDHDLNFPTKLALALRTAAARQLPVALYACGMGGHWSVEGDRRMRRALQTGALDAVFVRDGASKERWDTRFGAESGKTAEVVRDPGLLAQQTYGVVPREKGRVPVVGIGIMSHVAIRYHATALLDEDGLTQWYIALIRELAGRGARVVVFTNGAPEDLATVDLLRAQISELPGDIEICRPRTPAELSAIVGGCDAIVAYRMHAVIAAYSHGVPALALSWDDKLDAFMASIGREDWMADPADLPAEAAAERVLQAAEAGLDEARRTQVLAEALADVGRLYAALSDRIAVARS